MTEISAIDDDDRRLNVDVLREICESNWPAANDESTTDYSDLLTDVFKSGITTSSALIKLIESTRDKVMQKERERVENAIEELATRGRSLGTTAERTKRGVFYTFAGLIRSALALSYNG